MAKCLGLEIKHHFNIHSPFARLVSQCMAGSTLDLLQPSVGETRLPHGQGEQRPGGRKNASNDPLFQEGVVLINE